MKKVWKYFVLFALIGALMCPAALATDTITEPTFTDKAAGADFKLDASGEKFDVTYTGVTSGHQLILMVAEGTDGNYTINEDSIQYVDQMTAGSSGVSFTVHPINMVNAKIMMAGSKEGPVTLGYLKMPTPSVTVVVLDTSNNVAYEVSSDAKALTVVNEKACVVMYTTDGGETYQTLAATQNADGNYDFDLTNVPSGTEITVAVKGDLNGDGKVAALEARRILLASNDNYELTEAQKVIADANGDGKISALEARRFLLASNDNFDIAW